MLSEQLQPFTKDLSQSQTLRLSKKLGDNQTQGHSPLLGHRASHGHRPLGAQVLARGRGLLLAAGVLLSTQAPALAGSVTAESIWDRTNAIQRATSQIPRGATITGTSCQEVDLRGGSTRYICTVTYSTVPPVTAPQPATSPSPGPNAPSSNAPSAPAP